MAVIVRRRVVFRLSMIFFIVPQLHISPIRFVQVCILKYKSTKMEKGHVNEQIITHFQRQQCFKVKCQMIVCLDYVGYIINCTIETTVHI